MSNLGISLPDYLKDRDHYHDLMWLVGELVVTDDKGVEQFRFTTQNYDIEEELSYE